MAFDYKKEYKEFYQPGKRPSIVSVPAMNFVAIHAQGNPNEEGGEYKQAIGLLYAIAYTIKMSKMTDHRIDGYFDYIVPPLEGLWWQPHRKTIDFDHKEDFHWIALIRLPDFVSENEFEWAKNEAARKKKMDCSRAEFLRYEEGECVQILHVGPYDEEPASIALMDQYADDQGYQLDFSDERRHHEIYLSDPRRTEPQRCRTVIRHPIRKRV